MWSSNEFPFRRFQVVHDLMHVFRRAQGEGFTRIAAAVPGVSHSPGQLHQALDQMLDGAGLIPPEVAGDLYPCLAVSAAMPERNWLAFEASTALLLADRIMGGIGDDDIAGHWDAFHTYYSAASAPVRAALCQGYLLCRDLGLAQLDVPPPETECVTSHASEIRRNLLALARQLSADEMNRLAGPDRAVLEQVLGTGEWTHPEAFPIDKIELTASDPGAAGFLPCLALVCLNALPSGDEKNHMGLRWQTMGSELAARPEAAAVLAALRHVFETHPAWTPYAGWSGERVAKDAIALPWGRAQA